MAHGSSPPPLLPTAVLRGLTAGVSALCFVPQPPTAQGRPRGGAGGSGAVITGDTDGTLTVWSLVTRRPRATVAAAPRDDRAAGPRDGIVSLHFAWPGVLLVQSRAHAITVCDYERLAAAGSTTWGSDAAAAAVLHRVPVPHFGFCNVLALPAALPADVRLLCPDDGDGKLSLKTITKVTAEDGALVVHPSGEPRVLSAAPGIKLGQCMCLAATRESSIVAAGYESGHVVLLDGAAAATLHVVRVSSEPVVATAVSPPAAVTVGCADGVLQGYTCSPAGGASLVWEDRSHDGVGVLAVRPDGKLLLAGAWDHTLRLHDARSGKRVAVVPHHAETVNAVSFDPECSAAFACGSADHTVSLWRCGVGLQ